MFQAQQKSTGTTYTTVVALLVVAFIFVPTLLMMSRPFGFLSILLAIACSGVCVILAWELWRKFSRLTITSIAIQKGSAK
jgi:hypothetical protein